MGNAGYKSKPVAALKQAQVDAFVAKSNFSPPEIKALYFHFSNLSSDDKGELLINRSEFQAALGMKNSTFVDRLFAVFDENGDGAINFAEFLTILSVLSTKASAAEKLEVSFKIYDMDGDGKIGRDELNAMLRATADEHNLVMNEAELASVIDATFAELPECDGKSIDLASYSSLVESHPMMLSQLTLNISSLVADQAMGK